MDKLMKKMQKLTYIVNALITIYVVFFVVIFKLAGATLLWQISIGALAYYILAFILIWKNKLPAYIASLYIVLTVYMFAAVICIGLNAGFQLYCLSMIPLLFYFDYLGEQLMLPKSKPMLISVFIAVSYLASTEYVLVSGPIYEIDRRISVFFLASNSLWVILLLIFYSSLIIKIIRDYENRLKMQAMIDRLTQLYNRHFMINHLTQIDKKDASNNWVAILDIDNFKLVNDTYGHNAGDEVLKGVADILRTVCVDCTYARWGGEEFLISSTTDKNMTVLLEKLRSEVEGNPFTFDGTPINVTITIGACRCSENEDADKWVQRADKLLYEGKRSGKNRVVI